MDEADADGICDFYGLQTLLARGVIEGGHMLVRFRDRRPEEDFSVPLQLQLMEGDHLDALIFKYFRHNVRRHALNHCSAVNVSIFEALFQPLLE